MDKRRAPRHKKRLKVMFGTLGCTNVGFLVDISATGISVKTRNVYRPGTTLKMSINDGSPEADMFAEGYVAWAKKVPASMMRHVKCGTRSKVNMSC